MSSSGTSAAPDARWTGSPTSSSIAAVFSRQRPHDHDSCQRVPAGWSSAAATIRVLAAEALLLPSAVLLAAILSRTLGPSGYGLYALASTIVIWVEWTVASVLSRAIVRETSQAPDDERVATAAVRLSALFGCLALALVELAAPLASSITSEPRLTACLRLLAIDIPIFTVAMAHRSVLVGRHDFLGRAMMPVTRWTGRLLFVVLLVAAGAGLEGVFIGFIVATSVELFVARRFARVPLLTSGPMPWRPLIADALPFLALSVTLRLFDRIDLLLYKSLGGSTADAGLFGAAQGLAQALSLISVAFPPLLLATLTRLHGNGQNEEARQLAGNALRAVVWLLPVAGLVNASGPALAAWFFGEPFREAGPLLTPLVITAVLQVLMAVLIMVLTAAGYPNVLLSAGVGMVVAAAFGGLWLIPRLGAMGAATATMGAAIGGAWFAVWIASRLETIVMPLSSLTRAAAATVIVDLTIRGLAGRLPLVATLAAGAVVGASMLFVLKEVEAASLRRVYSSLAPLPTHGGHARFKPGPSRSEVHGE